MTTLLPFFFFCCSGCCYAPGACKPALRVCVNDFVHKIQPSEFQRVSMEKRTLFGEDFSRIFSGGMNSLCLTLACTQAHAHSYTSPAVRICIYTIDYIIETQTKKKSNLMQFGGETIHNMLDLCVYMGDCDFVIRNSKVFNIQPNKILKI